MSDNRKQTIHEQKIFYLACPWKGGLPLVRARWSLIKEDCTEAYREFSWKYDGNNLKDKGNEQKLLWARLEAQEALKKDLRKSASSPPNLLNN